jgi:hypothetical protein
MLSKPAIPRRNAFLTSSSRINVVHCSRRIQSVPHKFTPVICGIVVHVGRSIFFRHPSSLLSRRFFQAPSRCRTSGLFQMEQQLINSHPFHGVGRKKLSIPATAVGIASAAIATRSFGGPSFEAASRAARKVAICLVSVARRHRIGAASSAVENDRPKPGPHGYRGRIEIQDTGPACRSGPHSRTNRSAGRDRIGGIRPTS